MTMFEALVLAHLFGDWVLQTGHQAMNKMKGKFWNMALVAHCLWYTISFIPVFWFYGIPWHWLTLVYFSHMFLDRRWPVEWWIVKVKLTSREILANLFWLVIAVDQIFHVLIIALIAVLS